MEASRGKQFPNSSRSLSMSPIAEFLAQRPELCGILGDGVNQAADLISDATSIPSLNFTPLTTFGN
jgi:hypothetical protein